MEKKQIAQFEVNIPKAAKTLAKFANKDRNYRPETQYACISPSEASMTATDCHILQMVNLPGIVGEYPDNGLQILVEPKHITKVSGKRVTISVYEDKREVEETHSVYGGTFCGSRTVTEKVTRAFHIVAIECNGETLTTETEAAWRYPAVKRVIPKPDGRKCIRLTAESLEALKTICKLHKDSIALDIADGIDFVTVCAEVADYTIDRANYTLKLAEPAELSATIGFNPQRLATCLNSSNGVISFDGDGPQCRPITLGGEADVTLLMPCVVDGDTQQYIDEVRDQVYPASEPFADNAAAIVAELQERASELWQAIVNFHTRDGKCCLTPGNYSAKDITNRNKAKCGYYAIPDNYGLQSLATMKHGNIIIAVSYENLFGLLAAWEAAVKCKKSVFAVGDVEEVTATVLTVNEDGATEEKKKLRKLGGNWYCNAKRTPKSYDTTIYYEINGVIFSVRRLSWGHIEDADLWQSWVDKVEGQLVEAICKAAESDPYYAEVARHIETTRQNVATASETPQISTEAAETVKCTTEGEIAEIKHISELINEKSNYYDSIKNETLHTFRDDDGRWHTSYLGKEIGIDLRFEQINHIPATTLKMVCDELRKMYDYLNWLNTTHISASEYYMAEVRRNIADAKNRRWRKSPTNAPQPPETPTKVNPTAETTNTQNAA